MSHMLSGIVGASVILITVGAVQLASGHDAGGPIAPATSVTTDHVNRAAKSDRAASVSEAPKFATKVLALHPTTLADTSVVIRVPAAAVPRTNVVTTNRPVARRSANVGCEPVVSVLTEIAKSLAPGRCMT